MSSSKKDIIDILSKWKTKFNDEDDWNKFKILINNSAFKILNENTSFSKKKKRNEVQLILKNGLEI